jgi:predicted nucleic-acid-binding protein
MRAVDTNLLVRLIRGDDAGQTAAAEAFVEGGAWASQLVLVETLWVLKSAYGLTPIEIAAAVEMLLKHDSLVVQEPETVAAALAHFRRPHAPGFSDCLILEVARKNGHLPLGTFDRRLSKLPGAVRV